MQRNAHPIIAAILALSAVTERAGAAPAAVPAGAVPAGAAAPAGAAPAGTAPVGAAAPAGTPDALPESRQLTLAQALELVDRQNPDLSQRRARIDQADAAARQALAAVLPLVKATGAYTLNNQDARITPPGGGELVLQPRDAFTATGSVQVPLFAQNAYSDIGRARELARAERASYEADRHRLRGAVVRACWLVESAHSIVRVAERGVTSAEEHHESARRALADRDPDARAVATQIMRIPAPLLCYWMGATESSTNNEQNDWTRPT